MQIGAQISKRHLKMQRSKIVGDEVAIMTIESIASPVETMYDFA